MTALRSFIDSVRSFRDRYGSSLYAEGWTAGYIAGYRARGRTEKATRLPEARSVGD